MNWLIESRGLSLLGLYPVGEGLSILLLQNTFGSILFLGKGLQKWEKNNLEESQQNTSMVIH